MIEEWMRWNCSDMSLQLMKLNTFYAIDMCYFYDHS